MPARFSAFLHEYQAKVREAISLFRLYKGLESPAGWRQAGLAREGYLDPEKTIKYCFHGIGCRVKLPAGEIDRDFSYDENKIGLKAWFLLSFARYGTDGFPEFKDEAVLQAAFADAIRQGLIEKHSQEAVSGDMYFLRDAPAAE
jgi:hypothetical protein